MSFVPPQLRPEEGGLGSGLVRFTDCTVADGTSREQAFEAHYASRSRNDAEILI